MSVREINRNPLEIAPRVTPGGNHNTRQWGLLFRQVYVAGVCTHGNAVFVQRPYDCACHLRVVRIEVKDVPHDTDEAFTRELL